MVDALSVQLELGIPQDLLWLASGMKRDLDRGEYLSLYRAGLRDAASLAATDAEALVQYIRDKTTRRRVIDVALQHLKTTSDSDALPMPAPPVD